MQKKKEMLNIYAKKLFTFQKKKKNVYIYNIKKNKNLVIKWLEFELEKLIEKVYIYSKILWS